eukprot:4158315-Pyramimonas_sp.AAC.1
MLQLPRAAVPCSGPGLQKRLPDQPCHALAWPLRSRTARRGHVPRPAVARVSNLHRAEWQWWRRLERQLLAICFLLASPRAAPKLFSRRAKSSRRRSWGGLNI